MIKLKYLHHYTTPVKDKSQGLFKKNFIFFDIFFAVGCGLFLWHEGRRAFFFLIRDIN